MLPREPRRTVSVVEAPTLYDWPVLAHGLQKYGHFVFLRIDPRASVALLDIYLLGEGPAEPISANTPIAPAPQVADDHPPALPFSGGSILRPAPASQPLLRLVRTF